MNNQNKVIILGGGYSILEGIEQGLWEKIKSTNIWALNFCFLFMPYKPSTVLWYDNKFTRQLHQELNMLECKKISRLVSNIKVFNMRDVITYKATRKYENTLKNSCGMIYSSNAGLVGGFALSIAILEGYKEIYLLGFDYGLVTDKLDKNNYPYTHWYQDRFKKTPLISSGVGKAKAYYNDNRLKSHVYSFKNYNNHHQAIFNVSPKSNIDAFPKLIYQEFFERLKYD